MVTKPIDSDFIFELPTVSDPAIRPDGLDVAYVRGQVDREAMEGCSHIELVPFAGGASRQLTAGPYDGRPVWSPDGSTLAFLRKVTADGPRQIWLLPAEGGEARRLTNVRAGVLDLAWSPYGHTVVYISDVDPDAPPADDGTAKPGGSVAPHAIYNIGNNAPEELMRVIGIIEAPDSFLIQLRPLSPDRDKRIRRTVWTSLWS